MIVLTVILLTLTGNRHYFETIIPLNANTLFGLLGSLNRK